MGGVLAALNSVCEQLKAAGFAATVDPEALNTPCVYVQPRTLRRLTRDDYEATVWLYLTVANTDAVTAITKLDDMLEGVLEVFTPADTDDVIDLNAALLTPLSQSPLPAYRVAVDVPL